jgi:hypothetical protein
VRGLTGSTEVRRAFTGELYRYRLAVQDQLPRIEVATGRIRAERERIAAEEYDLLFAPSMSNEAFEAQLLAIHRQDIDLVWRIKTEVEFLLNAVYGILTMATAIGDITDGEWAACIEQAISRFREAAPDADLLRPVHVHLDDYIRGEGRSLSMLLDPTEEGAVAMLEDGPVYWVGGKLFNISEIAAAAEFLGRQVADCRLAAE